MINISLNNSALYVEVVHGNADISFHGKYSVHNHAERLLRFAVLLRKASFGTANEKGDRWKERIISLLQTCRLRGKRIFPVLVDAMVAFFNSSSPESAWIRPAKSLSYTSFLSFSGQAK